MSVCGNVTYKLCSALPSNLLCVSKSEGKQLKCFTTLTWIQLLLLGETFIVEMQSPTSTQLFMHKKSKNK